MFDNNKDKKTGLVNIIFDIRSSSVGIAFWQYIKNKPTIIYTDRQYILFEDRQGVNTFIDNIYHTLDQVINRVYKTEINQDNKLKKINEVLCVLSYPWYKAEIKNVNITEKKKKRFTKDYLNNKIRLIFDKNKDKNYIEIENKIISIYLNGYELDDPYNKEFESVNISAYKSIIGKITKEDLEDKIKKHFKYKNISFHTHPLSITSVLKNNFHSLNNFSLFNIGGEVTEVLSLENESLSKLMSINNGFNYLIRELSKIINENKNNTFSKIKLLSENELQDDKMISRIIDISKEWFKDVSANNKIKNHIFITVDSDFGNIMKKIFSDKDFYTNTLRLDKEPIVRIVNSDNTKGLALYSDGVKKDSILSILFNFQQLILNKIW